MPSAIVRRSIVAFLCLTGFDHCPLLARLLPKRIAYTSEPLEVLQLPESVDDLLGQRVSAGIEHFSRYVVAW